MSYSGPEAPLKSKLCTSKDPSEGGKADSFLFSARAEKGLLGTLILWEHLHSRRPSPLLLKVLLFYSFSSSVEYSGLVLHSWYSCSEAEFCSPVLVL